MNLRQLEYFVTVAEELHFARAADRLVLVPSHLSKQVGALERELGVKLFERSSRQVRLTPAGEFLLDRARCTLEDAARFLADAQQAAAGRVGRLRAAYCPGTGETIATLANAFRAERDDVDVDVEPERSSHDVITAIVSGRSRVGIARETAPELASLVLTANEFRYVALPNGHPLGETPRMSIEDLHGQPFLMIHRSVNPRLHDYITDFFRSHRVEPMYRYVAAVSQDELMDLVATHHGHCLVSSELLIRHPRSDILTRPLSGAAPRIEERLVWRANDDSPLVRAFVESASATSSALAEHSHDGMSPTTSTAG